MIDTVKLQTSSNDGFVYFPAEQYPVGYPPASDPCYAASYQFVRDIIRGNNEPLQRALQEKMIPLQARDGIEKGPLHWYFPILMLLDFIDKCDSFEKFTNHVPPMFQKFAARRLNTEQIFYEFKTSISPILREVIVEGTSAPESRAYKMAWKLVKDFKEYLPMDALHARVFFDAVQPKTMDVIQNFENTVLKSSPSELDQLAERVKRALIGHTRSNNPVATQGRWEILMRSPKLPSKGLNHLLYGAAFAAESRLVAMVFDSPRANEITPENAGDVLFQLVANKDVENVQRMFHIIPDISDASFIIALDRALDSGNKGLIDFFGEFIDRINQLERRLTKYTLHRVNKYYPNRLQDRELNLREPVRHDDDLGGAMICTIL